MRTIKMGNKSRKYYTTLLVTLTLLILILLSSCKKDNPVIPPIEQPPVIKDTITISVTGTTHRSIELKVQTTTNDSSLKIRLLRVFNSAETQIAEYSILITDTSIIDDDNGNGLQLNTEYTYFAVTADTTGQLKDTSNTITARTLAPTSHNYTWQEYTIGNWQSALYDVWGTDENNVYAVGYVAIDDTAFSIWHWDGIEWNPVLTKAGGTAIYGFSATDIWTLGGSIFHYNGITWEEILFRSQVLVDNIPYTSIWGTSSNDMYFGNAWGKIIHWNGNTAYVVASGYDNPLHDMDGISENFIIAVGTNLVLPSSSAFFNGNSWDIYPYVDSLFSLNSVSIIIPNEIYWGGEGIFRTLNGVFSKIYSSGYYVWDIDYNKTNGEIVACGSFDGVYVYNGQDWTSYKDIVSNDHSIYTGIYLTGNTIFCVGSTSSQAKIIIGKTN
jgi:hypothetical protein